VSTGEPPDQSPAEEPGEARPTPGEPPQHRLDPDLAVSLAGGAPAKLPLPVIDTRKYRWMIGAVGLALVVVFSIIEFTSHGVVSVGIPAGKPLHYFAAPLAASDLNGDANVNPPCTLARHDARALNICLLANRAPLVLAFFVTGSNQCGRVLDTLQQLSSEFSADAVSFAAVAVNASHAQAKAEVRSHGWTIPVAYDADGAVGSLYGVETCPLLELAHRGGIVAERLIGNHWVSRAALEPKVRALVGGTA
jgi:peroxiredoxin